MVQYEMLYLHKMPYLGGNKLVQQEMPYLLAAKEIVWAADVKVRYSPGPV